jgi:hypothetical protein
MKNEKMRIDFKPPALVHFQVAVDIILWWCHEMLRTVILSLFKRDDSQRN